MNRVLQSVFGVLIALIGLGLGVFLSLDKVITWPEVMLVLLVFGLGCWFVSKSLVTEYIAKVKDAVVTRLSGGGGSGPGT